MKKTFLNILVLLLALSYAGQLKAQWVEKNNGLYGGSIRSLAVSGTNLFAGTLGGGVFLTSDNGSSWTAVNTGLPNTDVSALAVSGTNIFAGTDGGGVFLSTNNGSSWTAVNIGLTNLNVKSLTFNGANIFAGTNGGGIFLSSNNGSSWTAVNTGLTNTTVNSLAVSGTNLFAGTNDGIFLSSNNGDSWIPVNTGLTFAFVRSLAISGTNLFAGTGGGGVFLSTNNGGSWTAVNTGLTNTNVYSLVVSGTNLFAGIWGTTQADPGVFLSTNNGSNWTPASTGVANNFVRCLAVNGTNLFAGTGGGGVFLSTNNGSSWTAVNNGIANSYVRSLVSSGTNLFTGTLGGVFLSPNGGNDWTEMNTGLTNTFVSSLAANGTNLFAGTLLGGVHLSTNNGSNWTTVSVGLTDTYVVALATSGPSLFAGTGGGGVFLSTNNGDSWMEVNTGLTNTLMTSFAVSGTNLFAGTKNGIFLSVNNGTSWTPVVTGLTNTNVQTLAISGGNIFAGTYGGGVFLSTNGGSNWVEVNSGLTSKRVSCLAVSGTNLLAGTYDKGVWSRPLSDFNIKVDQTITFNTLPEKTFGDVSFALSATTSSNLAVSYTSSNETVATISGNTVTIVGVGSTTITAKQAGNANYNAASDVIQILTVNPNPQDFRIWGTTNGTNTGIPDGFGSVFSMKLDGSNVINEHAFNDTDGSILNASVALGSDGFFYGTTRYGGAHGKGSVFKMKADGTGFAKIFDFNGTNGEDPHAGLIEGPDDFFYGVTTLGGAFGSGVVFKLKKDGTNFQNLTDLYSTTGYSARSSLLRASNGMLYGTTFQGGTNDSGSIFRMNIDGTGFQVLKDFGGLDGAHLNGSLIQALDGDLYGTAATGGQSDQGTIFKIKLDGTGFIKLHDFDLTNGGLPLSTLLQASNGQLYGTTAGGGNVTVPGQGIYNYGTVFRMNTNGTSFQELYDFNLSDDGRMPDGGLIQFPNGALYGITLSGGVNGKGTVFKINLDGSGYAKLYDFETAIGSSPRYKLTLANKLNQSIAMDDIPVLKMGDNPFAVVGSSSSGLALTYSISDPDIATITGNMVTMVAEGTTTITAKQSGNQYYLPAEDIVKSLVVTRKNQTITFPGLINKTLGDIPFDLTATSSSTLPISYASSNTSIATVAGVSVSMIGLGEVTITASQAGNAIYFQATDVPMTFRVKANQIITFPEMQDKVFGDGSFSPTTTSDSNLPVSYVSTNSSVATISGNLITITGAGTTTIKARQLGNDTYNAAAEVLRTLTVNKRNQAITFGTFENRVFGNPLFNLEATSTSELPVVYTSSDETVATISGNTVTIVGPGSTTITAKQAGNANYNAAQEVTQTLTINKADQTITFNALAEKTFGDASFALSATSTSNLPVSYTSADETIATISGNTVTIVGAGSVTITAKQAGNANYNAASDVTQTLTVNKAVQTITFNSLATKTFGESPFNLTATSTSGLAVQYSSASDKILLSGNQVTLIKPGSVSIKADQIGNTNFNAATPVSQSFCINPAKPTITTTGLNSDSPMLTSSSSEGNQWYENGTLITGAVSNTFTPTTAGSYTVKVTVDNCASELSIEQVLIITGDQPSVQSNGFFVYPNPADAALTIDLTAFDSDSDVHIIMYDLLGKEMERMSKRGVKATVSVGALPQGTYFIKASQRTRTHVAKFAKE